MAAGEGWGEETFWHGQRLPGKVVADRAWLAGVPPRVRELTARGDTDGLLALLSEPEGGRASYKAGECLAGVYGDRSAVEPLLRHLRAFNLSSPSEEELEDWKTVAFALACLEPPGSPAADELLAALDEWDCPEVAYAGWLLAAIGDRRAIDPLLRHLSKADPSHWESHEEWHWAALAFGKLRAVEAVDTFTGALPVAGSGAIEADIAEALWAIGDPRAIPALIAALEGTDEWPRYNDRAFAVNTICNALDWFGTPEAVRAIEAYEQLARSVPWLVTNFETFRSRCYHDPILAYHYAEEAEDFCEILEEIGSPEAMQAIQSIRAFVEPDWPKRAPEN